MFSFCKGEQRKTALISQADLAQTICQCGIILQDYNSQLQVLSEKGDMTLLSNEMKRGDGVFKESVECITSQIPTQIDLKIFNNLHIKVDEYCKLSSRMKDDLIRKVTELTTK